MSSKIELPKEDPKWAFERDSLLFRAVVGSRSVICALPYEVAMDGHLDGKEQERNTRAYFIRNRSHVEEVARRVIEESPEDAEMVVIRSL